MRHYGPPTRDDVLERGQKLTRSIRLSGLGARLTLFFV